MTRMAFLPMSVASIHNGRVEDGERPHTGPGWAGVLAEQRNERIIESAGRSSRSDKQSPRILLSSSSSYPRRMIDSATPYPIHALLSHESNLMYRIPPYQREYSWQKLQWEELFQDLVEADGSHFLGTIITLNKTTDAVQAGVLELIDGQQRMTTLTLLLASIYSVLKENYEELDEDARTDLTNLGRQLVRKSDGEPRVTPQKQGHNRDDYRQVLSEAGLNVDATLKPYYPARKMSKCYHYFRDAISKLAEAGGQPPVEASLRMLEAVKQAILVKIEVASHADAFVLFASLNNRGMPLTPVDLIKNHVLAEAERKNVMPVDDAFKLWNEMLTNLGDSSANQERFLRHYYNAFKSELPEVPNAPVATKTRLIRIFETLLAHDLQAGWASHTRMRPPSI